jgi:hypothetical protein
VVSRKFRDKLHIAVSEDLRIGTCFDDEKNVAVFDQMTYRSKTFERDVHVAIFDLGEGCGWECDLNAVFGGYAAVYIVF